MSPLVILPVHAFHSFSRQGSTLLSSSTIELPSDIVKPGAYSPDIVRGVARLHELRRTTRLQPQHHLPLRTPTNRSHQKET